MVHAQRRRITWCWAVATSSSSSFFRGEMMTPTTERRKFGSTFSVTIANLVVVIVVVVVFIPHDLSRCFRLDRHARIRECPNCLFDPPRSPLEKLFEPGERERQKTRQTRRDSENGRERERRINLKIQFDTGSNHRVRPWVPMSFLPTFA